MDWVDLGTSNLVQFKNVKNCSISSNNPIEIIVEFVICRTVVVTGNDWVALFPEGCKNWDSTDAKEMITFEFVLPQPLARTNEERRYKIKFGPTQIKDLNTEKSYQLVYYNRVSDQVIGVSSLFKFEPVSKEDFAVSTIVDQTNNNTDGKRLVKENHFKMNKYGKSKKSTLPNRDFEVTNKGDAVNCQEKNNDRNSKRNRLNVMNKVDRRIVHGSTSDSRCAPNFNQFTSSCSNCHRVNALLSSQAELFSQVKNLAEINNDLKQQICWLQKQVELGQAACQKLSVTLMHERQWKMFYQAAAAQERVDYHYQVMVVDQMHPEFLSVREQFVNERQRSIDKNKLGSALKLKAIIGSQEEKICSLTKEIEELKGCRLQKVKAIVKDIEKFKLDSEDLQSDMPNKHEVNVEDTD
uniref:SKICH domain-containing protein n=1 Tax=Graphocephala atropunctata TaxID=36148 RepID=A0A1B6LV93_9HEMI